MRKRSARQAPGGPVLGRREPGPVPQSVVLSEAELVIVTASLAELAARLDGFRKRLGVVEAAVQSSSAATSRSSRDSRSPNRSRSS